MSKIPGSGEAAKVAKQRPIIGNLFRKCELHPRRIVMMIFLIIDRPTVNDDKRPMMTIDSETKRPVIDNW